MKLARVTVIHITYYLISVSVLITQYVYTYIYIHIYIHIDNTYIYIYISINIYNMLFVARRFIRVYMSHFLLVPFAFLCYLYLLFCIAFCQTSCVKSIWRLLPELWESVLYRSMGLGLSLSWWTTWNVTENEFSWWTTWNVTEKEISFTS